jgi:hypothetical protein
MLFHPQFKYKNVLRQSKSNYEAWTLKSQCIALLLIFLISTFQSYLKLRITFFHGAYKTLAPKDQEFLKLSSVVKFKYVQSYENYEVQKG